MNREPCFRIEDADGIALVQLDAAYSAEPQVDDEFEVVLRDLIGQRARGVVLDLDRVQFLSARLTAALVAVSRTAEDAAVPVVLARTRPELDRMLRIRGLHRLFERFGTRKEALEHFGARVGGENSTAA